MAPRLFPQPRSLSPRRWVVLPGLQAPAGALSAAHRGADKMARGGKVRGVGRGRAGRCFFFLSLCGSGRTVILPLALRCS